MINHLLFTSPPPRPIISHQPNLLFDCFDVFRFAYPTPGAVAITGLSPAPHRRTRPELNIIRSNPGLKQSIEPLQMITFIVFWFGCNFMSYNPYHPKRFVFFYFLFFQRTTFDRGLTVEGQTTLTWQNRQDSPS